MTENELTVTEKCMLIAICESAGKYLKDKDEYHPAIPMFMRIAKKLRAQTGTN